MSMATSGDLDGQAWRQAAGQDVCNLIDTLLPQLQKHAEMADQLKGRGNGRTRKIVTAANVQATRSCQRASRVFVRPQRVRVPR